MMTTVLVTVNTKTVMEDTPSTTRPVNVNVTDKRNAPLTTTSTKKDVSVNVNPLPVLETTLGTMTVAPVFVSLKTAPLSTTTSITTNVTAFVINKTATKNTSGMTTNVNAYVKKNNVREDTPGIPVKNYFMITIFITIIMVIIIIRLL